MNLPRLTTVARGVLGLLLAFVLAWRPAAYGIAPLSIGLFWAFVLTQVAAPGMLLLWGAGLCRRDPVLLVGQGCAIGFALHGLGYFGARALGAPALANPMPAALVASGILLRRWGKPWVVAEAPNELGSPLLASLLVLVTVVCVLQPLFSLRLLGDPVPADLLFHAGNAAEARNRWPLENPRIAGLPLKYHVFSYALPAAASAWCELSVADASFALAPLFWAALAVLQIHNAGRVLFRDGLAAVLGTAVAVLHADPGRLLGLGPAAFNSYFATGFYGSPTTLCGFILLASITVALGRWLVLSDPHRARHLAPLVALAIAASATKASLLPTVAGGLVIGALASRNRQGLARAALVALAVVTACGAPFTLWLSTGESSYSGMFRWGPGAVMKQSAFAGRVAQWAITAGLAPAAGAAGLPLWLVPPIAGVWLLGYLALGGVGFLVWLFQRRSELSAIQIWALGVAMAGAAPGLLLDAQGLSQLFFLYNGQVMLALFAGAGLAIAIREKRLSLRALLLLVAALPALHLATWGPVHAWQQAQRARQRERSPIKTAYASGLAWLRTRAAENAVVFADNPSLFLSALGECRMFYESGLFSPRDPLLRQVGEPYPERAALQERLLRHPDRETVEEVQRMFPAGTAFRVVADAVQSRIAGGMVVASIEPVPARLLFPPHLFRLEFANGAMHVYRLESAQTSTDWSAGTTRREPLAKADPGRP